MAELKDLMKQGLIDSVKDCFKTTLSIDLIDNEDISLPAVEASLLCSVGFAGKLEGNIAVVIFDASACKVVGLMLGMEFPEVTPDVKDGFGEIGNIIAGGLKTRIAQAGYSFDITIPTTILGKELDISCPKDVIQIVRHFQSSDIAFDVILDFKLHQETTPQKTSDSIEGIKESALARLKTLVNDKINT
jgi:CheY-specific phosphatase CheX